MDLLSALQTAGDAIDKTTGGRAVRGLLAGKPRELLSPIPFSDSMGLTNLADATSGRDLTDAYGLTDKGSNSLGSHAAGFMADTLLSPMSAIGGYSAFKAAPTLAKGIAAGAKAATGLDLLDHVASGGRAVGNLLKGEAGYLKVPLKGIPSELADAADALGPMYSGGVGKMSRIANALPGEMKPFTWTGGGALDSRARADGATAYDRIMNLMSSNFGEQVAMEIPRGSTYLDNGAEAMAFRSPKGHVIRVADKAFNPEPRPYINEVLQPFRHTQIGPYTVEHLPFVSPLSYKAPDSMTAADAMVQNLKSRNYNPWDVSPRNMGTTTNGNYVIYDGGAVGDLLDSSTRGVGNPYGRLAMPGADMASHLIKMGSPEAVRRSMATGAAMGSHGQGVPLGDLLSALQSTVKGER